MTTWYDVSTNALLTVRVGSAGAIETNFDPTDPSNVWLARTSGISTDLYGVAWNGYVFAAVGASGIVILSTDGVSWVAVTSGVSVSLNAIASAGIVFLAVGDTGTIIQSPQGTVWSIVTSGTTEHLRGVATGNGEYIIVGDNSTVLTGTITTTVLSVSIIEGVSVSDSIDSQGTLNSDVTDEWTQDTGATRHINMPGFYDEYYQQALTVGETLTHEVSGDVEVGTSDSITDLTPVISEAVVAYEGLAGDLADSGSGLPLFQTVTEQPTLFQLGNFDDAIYDTVRTDEFSASDRLFENSEILRELIASSDALVAAYAKEALEAINLSDITVASAILLAIVSDNMSSTDTAVNHGIFVMTLDDSLTNSDALGSTALYDLLVSESLSALSGLVAPDLGSYFGLVINTKNKSITEYCDFDFNSMFMFNGNYYGVNDMGVHVLSGGTDGGSEIAAAFKTGAIDFGDTLVRISRAYIAMRSDGSMILKTITSDPDSTKRERHYIVTRANATLKTSRVKTLKKVRARYWQFEMVNVNGADFEIANLDFVKLKLTRRV